MLTSGREDSWDIAAPAWQNASAQVRIEMRRIIGKPGKFRIGQTPYFVCGRVEEGCPDPQCTMGIAFTAGTSGMETSLAPFGGVVNTTCGVEKIS